MKVWRWQRAIISSWRRNLGSLQTHKVPQLGSHLCFEQEIKIFAAQAKSKTECDYSHLLGSLKTPASPDIKQHDCK